MRIAFFGGSFNPPHLGHLAVAQQALNAGLTDRVAFAVAFAPPHKIGALPVSFEDRFAMTERMVEHHCGMFACDIEKRLQLHPSYTAEVLRFMRLEYPNDEIQLLIGGDSLRDLHLWYHPHELVRDYEILTYPRSDSTLTFEALGTFWSDEEREKLLSHVIPGDFLEISSTMIRKALDKSAKGVNIIAEEILPESVIAYVKRKNLYCGGENRMEETMKMTAEELAGFCLDCMNEKQGENAISLKLPPDNSVADYLVICTANSEPQINALCGFLERQVREKFALRPLSASGTPVSGWLLIDFGTVVVHVMTPDARDRYNLEGLWGDVPSGKLLAQINAVTER